MSAKILMPGAKAPSESVPRVEIRINEPEEKQTTARSDEASLSVSSFALQCAILAAVMVIGGVYVGLHLRSGWVPADDGILAQSALRVMQGQLPQRDFAEIYTGGLSFIHAAAFRLFGVSLLSLRICTFLFFLAWLPAVYSIALRFVSPWAAGGLTLLATVWGYANYTAAMPSWYNLFFATFGAAALMRYLRIRASYWLFLAGVCGGISILIKVIGLYYIAGVLLFLVFLEQDDNVEATGRGSRWAYRSFCIGGLSLFLGVLVYVLRSRLGGPEILHFVVPAAAVVGLIVLGERPGMATGGQRFKTLLSRIAVFGAGILAPIGIFLLPYLRSGSMIQFLSGVTSSAMARAGGLGVMSPPPIYQIAFVAPLVALIAGAMYLKPFQEKTVGIAVGLLALVVAFRAAHTPWLFSAVWQSVASLTPMVTLAGVLVIFSTRGTEQHRLKRQSAFLMVALAATCSLVQFPFAAPIYMCYTLPLTVLALAGIVSLGRREQGTYVLASLVGLYLVFGAVSVVPLHIVELTHEVGEMQKLTLPRGGIEIEGAPYFEQLAGFLQMHATNGLMYAGNDCPELYFLSGLKNVTRDDGGASPEEVLDALRKYDVKVVVINEAPFFPLAKMSPKVRAEVERKFPESVQAGIFHVYWKP